MANVSKILLPSLVGVSVYVLVNRFFPEEVEKGKNFVEKKPDSPTGVRGGADARIKLVNKIVRQILKDRALKIALISVFATAGISHFQSEIEALLIDDVFKQLCREKVTGELKIVCDIVKYHELDLHAESIRSLIIDKSLNNEQKISLLHIKLDYIINGQLVGNKRFLVMTILSLILSFTFSGVGGLALLMEALYRLFQEGKISEALYKQIIEALARKAAGQKVP